MTLRSLTSPLAPRAVLTLLVSAGPLLLGACDTQERLADNAANEISAEGRDQPTGPEPCDEYEAMRACADGEGTQFCDYAPGSYEELEWGECVSDFACMLGESRSCGLGEEFGDPHSYCRLQDGVPGWDEDACNTPLVLSFDGGPIETLSSAAAFDIAGVGACLATDWPAASNPWLAIDLDRNGFIDGGHELFGSGSILADGSHAAHGFSALASLDSSGDGRIDARDARFGELLVWRDDGDKLSMPGELSSLAEEGVTAIDLDYAVAEQCDTRGNCGRERAGFEFVDTTGARRAGEVVDIYLACQ